MRLGLAIVLKSSITIYPVCPIETAMAGHSLLVLTTWYPKLLCKQGEMCHVRNPVNKQQMTSNVMYHYFTTKYVYFNT